jgi:hypothetical protein
MVLDINYHSILSLTNNRERERIKELYNDSKVWFYYLLAQIRIDRIEWNI